MENKINISEILKDCEIGTELYSTLCGKCTLHDVSEDIIFIRSSSNKRIITFDEYGRYFNDSECLLFPSKDNRDWNTFKTEKPKFDPTTLKPFDKVIVSDRFTNWKCDFFSHFDGNESDFNFICVGSQYEYCIPYNNETKHLLGTRNEALEFYRYWED